MEKFDFLIVGAGFAGAVLAECIASQLGKTCLIVEKRHHIGGNAYDHHDAAGILVHDYGPHYFRTNSQRMVGYLSQFTEWRSVSLQNLILGQWPLLYFPISGAAKRWLHVNVREGILMTDNREHLNDYAPTIPYFGTAFEALISECRSSLSARHRLTFFRSATILKRQSLWSKPPLLVVTAIMIPPKL